MESQHALKCSSGVKFGGSKKSAGVKPANAKSDSNSADGSAGASKKMLPPASPKMMPKRARKKKRDIWVEESKLGEMREMDKI